VVDCFELETPESTVACSMPAASHTKKMKTPLSFFRTELGQVLAGLVKGLLVGLGVIPLRKRRWAFSVFLKGLQGLGFGSFRKPNHARFFKSRWRKGRKSHFNSQPKSPRCVSASPRNGDCPVANREVCILKSCAPAPWVPEMIPRLRWSFRVTSTGLCIGVCACYKGGPCLSIGGCTDAGEYSYPIVRSGEYHAQEWGFVSFLC
jgi:hypothetical protein